MAFPPTTPIRPIPGAFFNTPVASRIHLSSDFASQRPAYDAFISVSANGGASPAMKAVNPAMSSRPADSTAGMLMQRDGGQRDGAKEATDLPPVARAARAVNQFLQLDRNYPDLDSYFRQGASSQYDVQDTPWAPFHKTHMYPIPNQVFEHYNASQLQTLMGLFADINHAWVAIDNSLFLWDYTNPDADLIGFEDQPHTINAVALVTPKPGIFVETITHVLVVATAAELILLGLSATARATTAGSSFGGSSSIGSSDLVSVSLYQTKMSLPIRGVDVRVIVGSSTGRIFFGGGGEPDLNELYYQQEERWFWGRCGRINHSRPTWTSVVTVPPALFSSAQPEHLVDIAVDDSRKLIYTLSSSSTIRTYYMDGPDRVTKVIEKEKNHCLRDITHMVNSSSLLTDQMRIVSISPISAIESSKVHLMALTSTGCRLFLSATSSASYMAVASGSLAPQSMQVHFIKFPPGLRASPTASPLASPPTPLNATFRNMSHLSALVPVTPTPATPSLPSPYFSQTPTVVATAGDSGSAVAAVDTQSRLLYPSRQGTRFAPGYFFDFVARDRPAGCDVLFVSAPDTGRIKNTSATTPLRYHEQANVIEIGSRAEAVGMVTKPFAAAQQPVGFGNELAVQFDEPPGEFAVLTNTGVHIVRRRRFVDIFTSALRTAPNDDSVEKETRRFIHYYGRVETVSTALAVACGQGGDGRPGAPRATDQLTEDRARSVFVDFGGNPTIPETDGARLTTDAVKLSSRHDALSLYLARLVRMLWRSTVIKARVNVGGSNGGPGAGAGAGTGVGAVGLVIEPAVSVARLVSVQEALERLRRFLDANRAFIQGLSGPSDLERAASKQEEVALQAEHQALFAAQKLMEAISEGISFVLMLFEERASDIYGRLDDDGRRRLRDLTFESLFSQPAGKELAKVLVKAIVNRNIESGSNVETVADALRRRCGSFCSPDDVVIFKAQEQLKRASELEPGSAKIQAMVMESLRLFARVAGSLPLGSLQAAVEQYIQLQYFAGAIELCLVAARERDRGNMALSWVREGRPVGDPRAMPFAARKRRYDLVHQVLQRLDEASEREPEMVDGRPTTLGLKRMEAYDAVNSSDDEVFHYDLYEWYLRQDWTDRILATESPHVVAFLERLAAESAGHAELLVRFHSSRGRYFEAAQVQLSLAQSDFALGIKDRINLLSRAKSSASVLSATIGRQEQQFVAHAITDLLDVAHIQDDLLERLRADPRLDADKKAHVVKQLDGRVRDLSDLFNQYADQAGYFDLCLIIYHSADYRNAATIANTWRSLIQSAHDEAMAKRGSGRQAGGQVGPEATDSYPQPYEVVSTKLQTIAHRVSLDSFIFPIATLLPELGQYSVAHGQDGRIGADPAWPLRLFLGIGVTHFAATRLLEHMLDTGDYGFVGPLRCRVVDWLLVVVDAWLADLRRRGGPRLLPAATGTMSTSSTYNSSNNNTVNINDSDGSGGGAGPLAPWVGDLLARCDTALPPAGKGSNPGGRDVTELRRDLGALRRDLKAAAGRAGSGFGAGASLSGFGFA